jgi:predicted small secreted protein
MRKIIIAAALALSLAGCATVTQFGQKVEGVVSAVTGATVSPEAIIILANSFDAMQVTAKNYINPALNKRCNGSNGPICRDPVATLALNKAIREGRVARNNAKQFLRDHPGQLGTEGLYDALQLSVGTLQSIFTKYNIGAAQ